MIANSSALAVIMLWKSRGNPKEKADRYADCGSLAHNWAKMLKKSKLAVQISIKKRLGFHSLFHIIDDGRNALLTKTKMPNRYPHGRYTQGMRPFRMHGRETQSVTGFQRF